MQPVSHMSSQRGFSLITFIAGFLLGLILAAGVAFYITKTPVPFVDRVTAPEPLQVPNNWNPNASLQPGAQVPAAAQGNTTAGSDPVPIASVGTGNAPAGGESIASSGSESAQASATATSNGSPVNGGVTQFFVQAGAFASSAEAEQQRARLALLGSQAAVSQVVVANQTRYRVRIGPFANRDQAAAVQRNLNSNQIEANIVLAQSEQ